MGKKIFIFIFFILYSKVLIAQRVDTSYARTIIYDVLSRTAKKLPIDTLRECVEVDSAVADTQGTTCWTSMHECAMQNDTQFARKLIRLGVRVNVKNTKNNATPYIIATYKRHRAMYDLLLPLLDSADLEVETKLSHRKALQFLDSSERVRVAKIEKKIKAGDDTSLSVKLICETVKKYQNNILEYPLLRFIVTNDTIGLVNFLDNLTDRTSGPMSDVFNIDIRGQILVLDFIALAAIYNRLEMIVPFFIRNNELRGENPRHTAINGLSPSSLATDERVQKKIDSLFEDDPLNVINKDKPIVIWFQPTGDTPTIDTNQYNIAFCIPNFEQTFTINLKVNDKTIARSKSGVDEVEVNDECTGHFENILVELRRGLNKIKLEVRNNSSHTYTTDIKYILYKKDSISTVVTESRKAVVVGSSAGNMDPALNDIDSVSEALHDLSFIVYKIKDPTKSELQNWVSKFLQTLSDTDIVLIYYSGHGMIINRDKYMILRNYEKANFDSIFIDNLKTSVNNKKGVIRTGIHIYDACSSVVPTENQNPMVAKSISESFCTTYNARHREIKPALHQKNMSAKNTYSISASSIDELAYYSQDCHPTLSCFTAALLRHIRKPGIDIHQLLKMSSDDVKKTANQTPIIQAPEIPFYLNPYK